MEKTNLNIKIDKTIKDRSEAIFNELGLSMSAAINIFLCAIIRERGIPFDVNRDVPNEITVAAIEEGREMASDSSTVKYSSMDALRKALEE